MTWMLIACTTPWVWGSVTLTLAARAWQHLRSLSPPPKENP